MDCIKSILNDLFPIKGFVYEKIRYDRGEKKVIVDIRADKRMRARCSGCGERAAIYERGRKAREWEFIPIWKLKVIFRYPLRRVKCERCGVKVEKIPWSYGKERLCWIYQRYLSELAKKLNWSEVARLSGTTWQNVYRSVKKIVEWGLARRKLENIKAIGIDEVKIYGKKLFTVIYELGAEGRLLWMGSGRDRWSVMRFFEEMGEEKIKSIKVVCCDMWQGYFSAVREKLRGVDIVLDKFHIVMNMNKVVDLVRKREVRESQEKGYALKYSRWCLLKKAENLRREEKIRLKDVLKIHHETVKAYLLKETFRLLWGYKTVRWARWFLRKWVERANKSRIPEMKRVAKTLRRYEREILNWFKWKKEISNGMVEAYNRQIKLSLRLACGFRNPDIAKMVLFHRLARLPTPSVDYEFW